MRTFTDVFYCPKVYWHTLDKDYVGENVLGRSLVVSGSGRMTSLLMEGGKEEAGLECHHRQAYLKWMCCWEQMWVL